MLSQFLSGAIFMAYLCAALLLRRLGQRTQDRLFQLFAIAFTILAAERVILLVVGSANEFTPFVYLVRLAAFSLIIVAIIDKNRR